LALTLIHLRIPEIFREALPSLSRVDDTGERIGAGERARAMVGGETSLRVRRACGIDGMTDAADGAWQGGPDDPPVRKAKGELERQRIVQPNLARFGPPGSMVAHFPASELFHNVAMQMKYSDLP
ncbi:MAG: hypothetical protein WBM40_02035, partial [Thiohalocapsa sp.]